MNSTTLRGIFSEPKPQNKRNFIKENVKQIKQIQMHVQSTGAGKESKDVNSLRKLQSQNLIAQTTSASCTRFIRKISSQTASADPCLKCCTAFPDENKETGSSEKISNRNSSSRGIQTEDGTNLKQLYMNGIVKYPSPHLKNVPSKKNARKSMQRLLLPQQGNFNDAECHSSENVQETNGKHDYIKENVTALKRASSSLRRKRDESLKTANTGHVQLPSYYQKGIVPKYLQQRTKELPPVTKVDTDLPEGHVLLPDNERKETLKVLRQSYAERIQELNAMPVRNDTLKMLKRKMELEDELKKIDEGIKVFQRLKVFVKVDA